MNAIKDPNDKQKMEKAVELVSNQQLYKNTRKDARKIPQTLEWLCPKNGKHVNSIDSLLHSDDLLKETPIKGREIPLKDKFENSLRKMNVVRWEGVVKKIKSDWIGTITFRKHIDVHFVPNSIRSSRPALGDTVSFHLSFDWNGPSAWSVMRDADSYSRGKATGNQSSDDSDGTDDEGHGQQNNYNIPTPLWSVNMEENEEKSWKNYVGKQMIGVVVNLCEEERFGFVAHPDVEGSLYFSLNDFSYGIRLLMILKFRVAVVDGKSRAHDIDIAKVGHRLKNE